MGLLKSRIGAVIASLLLLTACATSPTGGQQPLLNQQQLTAEHTIPSVPFFAQTQNQCGPAALATLLNYRGNNSSVTELSKKVFIPARGGSLQIELAAQARQANQIAYPLQPSLSDLITEVAHNNPVLVMQNLRFSWWPKWHYAVVKGYDQTQQEIILNSGTTENYRLPVSLFDKTWAGAKRWGLVILPADKIPASAEPRPLIKAINDLEQSGQFEAAETGYKTALTRWPDNQLALFGMANFYHVQGDYPQASTLYQELINQSPNFAQGWNNYAYLLLANHCPQQATQSASCAVNLEPDNSNYRATLKEISVDAARADHNKTAICPQLNCPLPL